MTILYANSRNNRGISKDESALRDSRIPVTYRKRKYLYTLGFIDFLWWFFYANCDLSFGGFQMNFCLFAGVCSDIRLVFWEDNSDMSDCVRWTALFVYTGASGKNANLREARIYLLRTSYELSWVSISYFEEIVVIT